MMDETYDRLAYNVFHMSWTKFGVPEKDIPPPNTEQVELLNDVIPSYVRAVICHQIASREELKEYFDNFRSIPDPRFVYSFFENMMKEALFEEPDSRKNTAENIRFVVTYTLAVCIEFVLYKYEDHKIHMGKMSGMWKKYFEENLKTSFEHLSSIQDLKAYGDSLRYIDPAIDKFTRENRKEYQNPVKVITDWANEVKESPNYHKFMMEIKSVPKERPILKIKAKFHAIVGICKCVKGFTTSEETPLLMDYSPSTPDTTPT